MIDYVFEEQAKQKNNASELLEKLKRQEKKTKFYKKRLNNNTIVMCKNEDKIEIFRESLKLKNNIIVCK